MKLIEAIFSLLIIASLVSCEKDQVYPEDHFFTALYLADSSSTHPKGIQYQVILDEFIQTGAPGVSVMINDESGTWLGASGFADLKSNVPMQPGNQFQIASISKVFTAACIFSYVDDGLLSIDDPVTKWIGNSITDKVDNTGEAKIRHLRGLKSAYYGTGDERAADGVAKGYTDLLSKGEYMESDALDMDILGVGGAGGIAINAQDLGMFMMHLMAGNVVSESSLAQMQDWFEKPMAMNHGHTMINGYGLVYHDTDRGVATGHNGMINGWHSMLFYYPEEGIPIVILFNFVPKTYKTKNERNAFLNSLDKAVFE